MCFKVDNVLYILIKGLIVSGCAQVASQLDFIVILNIVVESQDVNGPVVKEPKFCFYALTQLFLVHNKIATKLLDGVGNSHLLQVVANIAGI